MAFLDTEILQLWTFVLFSDCPAVALSWFVPFSLSSEVKCCGTR